jgi:hypothetical protein
MEDRATFSSQLIFILGAPRSGTTLLQSLLIRNQPQFTGSRFESQLYNMHLHRPYRWSEVENHPFYSELVSPEVLRSLFDANQDYLSLFCAYAERVMADRGKQYFSDKYPIHTLWFREIARDLPQSRWIVITRHPLATVHSYATTRIAWWRIWADGLPFGLSRWTFLRYLNATWVYHQYSKVLPKVSADSHCLFTIAYEDLVLNPSLFSEAFEKSTGIRLAPLDPGGPASSVNSNREDAFMRESLEAYKTQMPRWAQRLAEDVFFPQRGLRSLSRLWWLACVIGPIHLLKRMLNALRGQRN